MSSSDQIQSSLASQNAVFSNFPQSNAAPHLVLDKVSKEFGGSKPYWAVKESSFEVMKGEFFGLLGPSGCGKSTTLNIIAGFQDPTTGEVRLSGRRLNGVLPHQRHTAMVFQDYALFPHLSAADNIAFGPRLLHKSAEDIKKKVGELLELVGLSHRASNLPAQMSGGEQQRIALARALAIEPEVVLLDEPLSNLDARLRIQMRRQLKQILSSAGVTVVFVTHDQAEAFAVCDRVAVMEHGAIEDLGPPTRLYHRPRTEGVARFVGEGNFFAAEVTELCGDHIRTRVKIGDWVGEIAAINTDGSAIQTKGHVLIRPESIVIGSTDRQKFIGTVERAEFLGAFVQYEVKRGSTHILAHAISQTSSLSVGETVSIGWRDQDCVFLADKAITA